MRYIALIVGGPNPAFAYDRAAFRSLLDDLFARFPEHRLVVTTSRRTPSDIETLIDRYPFIIYAGGALLGYVAGEMLVTEASLKPLMDANHYLHWLVPGLCAVFVLATGWWLAMRKAVAVKVVDLVDGKVLAGMGDSSSNSQKVSVADEMRGQ